ncbi:MAG: helix-turn-helix transcriptional regulator [Mycoplasmataceae bacterium]|nr:helix-turn-helix transcriptional regulator [Mycoplasmataceae bacterium]
MVLWWWRQHIKELRIQKGMSQESFAFVIGLDITYISGLEHGRRNIAITNIKKIGDALKIEVWEFFKDFK